MPTLHISTHDSLYALDIEGGANSGSDVDLERIGGFGGTGALVDVLDIGFAASGGLYAVSDGFGETTSRVLSEVFMSDAALNGIATLGDGETFNGLGRGMVHDLAVSTVETGDVIEVDLSEGAIFEAFSGAGFGSAGDLTLHEGLMAYAEIGRRSGEVNYYDDDGDLVASTRVDGEVWGLASLGENNLIGAVGGSILRIDDETGAMTELYDLSAALDGPITGLAFGGTAAHDILSGGNGRDRIKGGIGDDVIEGGNGRDVLLGARGDDILSGDNGKDLLRGNAGDDWLTGGNGKDKLIGGGGSDILDGGRGPDRIDGGFGDDLLIGGKGRDVFAFHHRPGDDVIADWGNGPDMLELDLRRVNGFEDLVLEDTRDGLLITAERFHHFSVLIEDADAASFSERDVIFV
ncbi:MAG: calcium-binding protein [Pseudomonadota bacterium]|nr:calcium-binding protein [Pseudomonadota bacterium]